MEGQQSSIFQSPFWASFKEAQGWTPYFFQDEGVLLLYRRFAPGAAIAYVPHADMKAGDAGALKELSKKLARKLPPDTMLIRWDLPWKHGEILVRRPGSMEADPFSLSSVMKKAPVDVQPPSTVLLDISRSEEEIMAGMKSKTRYNIRLSARKGVEVSSEGEASLDQWYDLYRETAERDKIAIHPQSYYQRLFQLAREKAGERVPKIDLLMARHEGEALAGIILARYGSQGTYLYGAGGNRKRNLMPAYALQWKAIQMSKESDCSSYDFFGIPPADDPEHPMHGLYRFKTGFGGELVHRPGCWDMVLKPLRGNLYRSLETLRRWYYLKYRKR